MLDRHDLIDEEWVRLEPLLPDRSPRRGGRWLDHRVLINGVLWRTPARGGPVAGDPGMTATAGRFVGQSVPRREDPRMLTGRGRYIDDVTVPGMLHAAFVRSGVARGRIATAGTQRDEPPARG